MNRNPAQKYRRELTDRSTELLCIKEDLYTELNTFGQIKLNPKGARYFANGDKRMLVIYHPEFVPYLVAEIDNMEVTAPIMVYIYSPGRYAYDDEFAAVSDKVRLCALPQTIIEAMARVMPEKADGCKTGSAAHAIDEPDAYTQVSSLT